MSYILSAALALLSNIPEIAHEVDLERSYERGYFNNVKKPFAKFSHKKLTWTCKENPEHIWDTLIKYRSEGSQCPFCTGKQVLPSESLEAKYPDLMREWDYEKNTRNPNNISLYSHYKAHWICEKHENHTWNAHVYDRTRSNKGCPYCTSNRLLEEDSIYYQSPNLMAEWDFKKNEANNLDPKKLAVMSSVKAHWICSENPKHKWKTSVSHRQRGTGCPFCVNDISNPQKEIYRQLKERGYNVVLEKRVGIYRIDIYFPDENVCVEYDGWYFHQDYVRDMRKDDYLNRTVKATIIRVREEFCPIYDSDFVNFLPFEQGVYDNLEATLKPIVDEIAWITDHLKTSAVSSDY